MYNYFIVYKCSYHRKVRYTIQPEIVNQTGNCEVRWPNKITCLEEVKKIEEDIKTMLDKEEKTRGLPGAGLDFISLHILNWKRFEDE